MDGHEWKRSGQIPPFGNWDYTNELPITQYFESARQAGLIRYSSSSAESSRDLYAVDINKKGNGRRNRERIKEKEMNVKMNIRKQGKVCDVREQARKVVMHAVPPPPPPPKPVDEDLYKIPPHLLRKTKRKKMLGFISKCLVPAACIS